LAFFEELGGKLGKGLSLNEDFTVDEKSLDSGQSDKKWPPKQRNPQANPKRKLLIYPIRKSE
jgi:hypothetical protein